MNDGKMIAKVSGQKSKKNKYAGRVIYVDDTKSKREKEEIDVGNNLIKIVPNVDSREVIYVAGPSGSGKSHYAANYIKNYITLFPKSDFFVFSRTDIKDDPVFNGLNPSQVTIDEELIENPIDITTELKKGSIILFDDVNTIQNTALKKIVDDIMADIMEVGRKLCLYIVITNHLIIPNERKIARTILNECNSLTVFPKSGSTQQIKYALKNYFGYSYKQIDSFIKINSRWLTFTKSYPQMILSEHKIILP
jgi:adenosyl cobinamide kinase/adenosyl cobinamide phosphate guanylyltransferase